MKEHSYLISDPLCGACPYVRFTPLIFKDCKKCLTYIKENLTMEEKPIKIIIENYKNETKVYEIPQSAQIDIYTVHILNKGDVVLNAGPIVGMSIEVEVADDDKPIKIIEEDI